MRNEPRCLGSRVRIGIPRVAVVREGVTLLELLVVISIIGMLMALLLPAVQTARESARRIDCANHLRQVGLALLQHETVYGRFPSGGWGGMWVADPDRGSGRDQPGGWAYGILPYLERNDLYTFARGAPEDQKPALVRQLLESPLEVFYCPTRRGVDRYAVSLAVARTPIGSEPVNAVARSDYAINAGDQPVCDLVFNGPPTSWDQARDPAFKWPDMRDHTGISFLRSEIRIAHVRDGKAHTYLVAEKHVSSAEYVTGGDHGDDWSLYSGYQDDMHRTGYLAPLSDDYETGGMNCRFGSAHPGMWNACFCDGSIRAMSFEIDLTVHRRLANRADKGIIDDALLK
jgi:prepilin-type N-terminal cleavage/methylation domain-containing protein